MPNLSSVGLSTNPVPATASTTTVGNVFSIGPQYDSIVIVAELTGMSASTLDVYLQESWDAGVTWYDVVHYTQLAGGAAKTTTRQVLVAAGTATAIGKGTAVTPSVGLAANKVLDPPWGPLLRPVFVVGAGVNAGAVTQTLTVIGWRRST